MPDVNCPRGRMSRQAANGLSTLGPLVRTSEVDSQPQLGVSSQAVRRSRRVDNSRYEVRSTVRELYEVRDRTCSWWGYDPTVGQTGAREPPVTTQYPWEPADDASTFNPASWRHRSRSSCFFIVGTQTKLQQLKLRRAWSRRPDSPLQQRWRTTANTQLSLI